VSAATSGLTSADEIRRRFDEEGYLADEGMATALFLTLELGLPLLLEGEPGVGKTAAAQTLARVLGAPLVRLQCYEGLTASEALYDWNHQRQLLAIRLAESQHERLTEAELFSEEFLVERPILRCVRHTGPQPPVLLIDEVDRAADSMRGTLAEGDVRRRIITTRVASGNSSQW
jgi:MoxR-like ATPase